MGDCSISSSTGCGSRRSRPAAATRPTSARGGVGRRPRRGAPAARRSSCRSATATRSPSASCAPPAPTRPTVLIYGHYDVQGVGLARAPGRRRRSSPRCATGASTPAAPPTTRATSGRCCPPPASSRGRASSRSTCASSSRARRRRAARRSPSGSAPTSAAPTRRSCSTPAWSTSRRPRSRSGCAAWRWRRSRCAPASATCTRGSTAAASSTRCTSCTACSPQVVPGPDGTRAARSCAPASSRPPRPSGSRGSGCRPATQVLSEVGGRPAYPGRGGRVLRAQRRGRLARGQRDRRRRAAHGRAGRARARRVSLRLAPGQRAAEIGPVLERLLRDAAPADADVTMAWHHADPSLFEPDLPALVLGAQAIERATGTAPALIRSGGSIPVVAEFAAREHPHHRERLRAPRRRLPRARRVVPAREPRARRARRARAAARRSRSSEPHDLGTKPLAALGSPPGGGPGWAFPSDDPDDRALEEAARSGGRDPRRHAVAAALVVRCLASWQPDRARARAARARDRQRPARAPAHARSGSPGAFFALVLAMALCGPAPAVMIGFVSVLVDSLRNRLAWHKLLTNLTVYSAIPLVVGLGIEALEPVTDLETEQPHVRASSCSARSCWRTSSTSR